MPRLPLAAALLPVAATLALVGASGPGTASAATVVADQACQYSTDGLWRSVPGKITGTLRRNGVALAPGQAVSRGDVITLTGAQVSTELDPSIAPQGYDLGVLPYGVGSVPVRAWIALEATGTAQGITAPIAVTVDAVSHVSTAFGEEPTPGDAYFDPVVVPLPDQTWTATGGDVVVRQAPATRMAAIPAGRGGADVRVNGSVFVSATLGADIGLYLDCAPGAPSTGGTGHEDVPSPGLLSAPLHVPGFTGSVDGTPLSGDVDATVESAALPRAVGGEQATIAGGVLRLRLTAAQRSTWLGTTGTATLSGALPLVGARSAQGTATVGVSGTADAAGGDDIVLDVQPSVWTPTGSDGVDVRTDRVLQVTADGPAGRKVLRLERADASAPYPFAYVLGPDPLRSEEPTTTDVPGTVEEPPALGGGTTFAPPPPPTPGERPTTPASKGKRTATIRVASSSLRRRNGRVVVTLANLRPGAVTRGRVRLVTTAAYRLRGARHARRITLGGSTEFALPKGRRGVVRVRLTTSGAALLRTHRSVRATVTVTPSETRTQRKVTRALTVRR